MKTGSLKGCLACLAYARDLLEEREGERKEGERGGPRRSGRTRLLLTFDMAEVRMALKFTLGGEGAKGGGEERKEKCSTGIKRQIDCLGDFAET